MGRLNGKRALIAGGTSGIGLETARRFLKEGARVAITGSSDSSVRKALSELGRAAIGMAADAGDLAAQRRVADWVKAELGGLDTFVNAGIVDMKPLADWDEASFDRSFAVNLKGPFFLVQALLPLFANPSVTNKVTRSWCNGAGIPQCFALHALRTLPAKSAAGLVLPLPHNFPWLVGEPRASLR
jgi:NAD(P)-dependent dehydrogenase (short-subunit alcohol dehydrogenase family)